MSEAVLEAPWLCIDAHCGARLPRGKGGGGTPGPGAAVQLLITFRGGGTGGGSKKLCLIGNRKAVINLDLVVPV